MWGQTNEERAKYKWYVLYEATLKELGDLADGMGNYNTETLYNYDIDRSDLSGDELLSQKQGYWYAKEEINMHVRDEDIYTNVKKTAYECLNDGVRECLYEKLFDKIMNTKLYALLSVTERDEKGLSRINSFTSFGEPDDIETSTDKKEMGEILKGVKRRSGYGDTAGVVWFETASAVMSSYNFRETGKRVKKIINKFLREEMTYCIKSGKIIVPEEYLKKGENGIQEWRDLKKSKNKNNNMEKQILKQAFHDKKERAYKSMVKVMDKATTGYDWSLPSITIDGRWNKGKTNKLITQLVKTGDKKEFMGMSDELIFNIFKEYWKQKLMDAYNDVDKMKLEEE